MVSICAVDNNVGWAYLNRIGWNYMSEVWHGGFGITIWNISYKSFSCMYINVLWMISCYWYYTFCCCCCWVLWLSSKMRENIQKANLEVKNCMEHLTIWLWVRGQHQPVPKTIYNNFILYFIVFGTSFIFYILC